MRVVATAAARPHQVGRQLGALLANLEGYAKTAEDRQVFGLIFGVQALGRFYGSTPEVPAERRNALRAAFMATMSDPQFQADAAKTQIDVSPMTGAEVEAFIAGVAASPPEVVERAKRAARQD